MFFVFGIGGETKKYCFRDSLQSKTYLLKRQVEIVVNCLKFAANYLMYYILLYIIRFEFNKAIL
jgi:hypothetical protein